MIDYDNRDANALHNFLVELGYSSSTVQSVAINLDDETIEVELRRFPEARWGHRKATRTIITIDYAYNERKAPF